PRQAVRRTIVATQPHEAFVVDMDSVLSLRPFVTVTVASPGFDVVARRIEHDHGRRRLGRILGLERPWPMQNPDIVAPIDCDTRRVSQFPLRRHLWPGPIDFEGRQTTTLSCEGNSKRQN